jgi:hypothetical protein
MKKCTPRCATCAIEERRAANQQPAGSLPDVTPARLREARTILIQVAAHAPDVDANDRDHIRYVAHILDELVRAGGLWIDTTN